MATVKKVKKYQKSGPPIKATTDSSAYYKNQEDIFNKLAKSEKGNSKVADFNRKYFKDQAGKAVSDQLRQYHKGKPGYDSNGNPIKKNKTGGKVTTAKNGKQMIKRADGSYSQRGLWDNIRAAKGSGKKPTAAMLKQEKKIKAKSKK
jgi:hypothetical protein